MIRNFFFGLVFLLGACATPPQSQDHESDLLALQELSDTWRQLYLAGDFDAMQDLYEPDAWLMTRDRPARKSRKSILDYFQNSRSPGLQGDMTFEVEDTQFSGDHAYQTSLWWFAGRLADGRTVKDSGRSFIVYKRGPDREWRLWRDIDNHTPDSILEE